MSSSTIPTIWAARMNLSDDQNHNILSAEEGLAALPANSDE